jgi:hypothetical protein
MPMVVKKLPEKSNLYNFKAALQSTSTMISENPIHTESEKICY